MNSGHMIPNIVANWDNLSSHHDINNFNIWYKYKKGKSTHIYLCKKTLGHSDIISNSKPSLRPKHKIHKYIKLYIITSGKLGKKIKRVNKFFNLNIFVSI